MYGYSEGVRCGNVHGLRRLVACPLPRLALGVGHPVGVIPAAHARHEVDGGSTRDAGEGAVHRERGQRRAPWDEPGASSGASQTCARK